MSESKTTADIAKQLGGKKCIKRAYSLLGPAPKNLFGPKATTMPCYNEDGQELDAAHPTEEYDVNHGDKKLKWCGDPENVLIVKKIDAETVQPFIKCASWLVQEKNLNVFAEMPVFDEDSIKNDKSFASVFKKLQVYTHTTPIDLIICLGGDGTLLYAASLFQHSMPPVVPFHMGSLGFMTSHQFETMEDTLTNVLTGQASLMLRSRLRCIVSTANRPASTNNDNAESYPDKEFHPTSCMVTPSTDCCKNPEESDKTFLVLNEVSIHRGTSSCLCNVDLFLMERQITSVQGDGLVISTPTGSTGYAVAAGASVVHPQVPSIMVTPICPHSLSFRPLIVPAGAQLKLAVSENARAGVNISFDGRDTMQFNKGDTLTIRTSTHPTPCVCRSNPFDDWFDSLSECLLWNTRLSQKKIQSNLSK